MVGLVATIHAFAHWVREAFETWILAARAT
jgi:hypothetical protein